MLPRDLGLVLSMKATHKDPEKIAWGNHQVIMRSTPGSGSASRILLKLMLPLILFVSGSYIVYTLKLVSAPRACHVDEPFRSRPRLMELLPVSPTPRRTEIQDVVFGIAASAKLWAQRKEYIKLWYRPGEMRGAVWLDDAVEVSDSERLLLPPARISEDTSRFPYSNPKGHRSAIRISRIVSETIRLAPTGARWLVMGDDDTVFIVENLLRVLRNYDHEQFYYIGSLSESHIQNIHFSYGMAYGGGGFAISYLLAKALEKVQDRCILRYPLLYGSDDRIQACMAELGVPLTKHVGFHQYDVFGDLFGLLAAHPVTPFVSLHHLDVVEPIFPNVTRVQALQRLMLPMKLDSAALMQQSICYHKSKGWTISVSWGFAVQIFRSIFSPREIEMPSRTFLNWYKKADYTGYAFNTRPVSRNPCQKPFVFYLSEAKFNSSLNLTVSKYVRHHVPHPACRWKMANPEKLGYIVVHKRPDPHLWDRSPRRNCCRIVEDFGKKGKSMTIEVGLCKEGEISEV